VNTKVLVPEPELKVTVRSVAPVSNVSCGVPETVTTSVSRTRIVTVDPAFQGPLPVGDDTHTTVGAVESTVTDVPDTNDKFPAASTEYAT
jgi:hypothetical protein